jgi:hypothetical protein
MSADAQASELLQAIEELSRLKKFKPSDFGLIEDPNYPARSALGAAYTDAFNNVISTVLAMASEVANHPGETCTATFDDALNALKQHLDNFSELHDWLFPPREPISLNAASDWIPRLQELGYPFNLIYEIVSGLQKRKIGRPHSHLRRDACIHGFERQLGSRRCGLHKVTRELCPCAKSVHSTSCEQNMRAGIRSLKKVLHKHAPELVSRYEKLHPDRDKKVNGEETPPI